MPRRFWGWIATAALGVVAAVAIDLLVFPSPRSSQVALLPSADVTQVSLAPALRPGQTFADRLTLIDGTQRWDLSMTGSYVRSRHVLVATLDFYEIASYSDAAPLGSAEEMLEGLWRDHGRKAYVLRFLVPVPGWQLRQAVKDEIARSFTDVSLDTHRDDIDRLLDAFAGGAHADDVFYLARLPRGQVYFGMRSEKNLTLTTSSAELARAIWRMWAGPTAEPGRAGLVKRLSPVAGR